MLKQNNQNYGIDAANNRYKEESFKSNPNQRTRVYYF